LRLCVKNLCGVAVFEDEDEDENEED